MEIGLGHMRMSRADFWGLSFREWRAAVDGYQESLTGASSAQDTMPRTALRDLMEAHPDD